MTRGVASLAHGVGDHERDDGWRPSAASFPSSSPSVSVSASSEPVPAVISSPSSRRSASVSASTQELGPESNRHGEGRRHEHRRRSRRSACSARPTRSRGIASAASHGTYGRVSRRCEQFPCLTAVRERVEQYAYRKVWTPAQQAAGFVFTLYDRRHTFFSGLLAAGIAPVEFVACMVTACARAANRSRTPPRACVRPRHRRAPPSPARRAHQARARCRAMTAAWLAGLRLRDRRQSQPMRLLAATADVARLAAAVSCALMRLAATRRKVTISAPSGSRNPRFAGSSAW